MTSILKRKKDPFEVWEEAFFNLVKGGSFLLVLPFRLDKEAAIVLPCKVLPNVAWHILLLLYWLDVCYMASVARHVTLSRFPEKEFVNFYVHFLSRMTAGVLAVIIAADKELMRNFHNVMVHLQRNFKGKKCT